MVVWSDCVAAVDVVVASVEMMGYDEEECFVVVVAIAVVVAVVVVDEERLASDRATTNCLDATVRRDLVDCRCDVANASATMLDLTNCTDCYHCCYCCCCCP
jgi:hypothetical protein